MTYYPGALTVPVVTSAGPNITVTQDPIIQSPGLSKGAKIALAVFGIGVLVIGALAVIRR